ncbi:tripartite tricarboxylate transporter TctB family protein [Bradyrhizobium zhanjiangense]|uniref:Tripartite tricarboxylate transporter TctB family protein n=1 Tax=Bradyrhizobium zhanjiangense TaxID=1325107 RepID=A0A4Q0QZA2_9BRAD|nr:tripartite tricarboxylate transporter TctB family protein [Bradyrhizobium zhanjiangense]RXG98213.1 tripartite tricarboxylate transporter TctB family protein [Bradyrhizobium zhanjiangense]RXH02376.1 tripartite tricarboxylate transporter TctB family protein [Bradyrhizobium zhanjiangense]
MARPTIRNQRAFASGALFLAFAIFFFVMALNYPAGTAARMGPGYFPRLLAIVLAAIGLAVMLGAVLRTAERQRLRSWDVKGLAWVTGSVILFALLLFPIGLIGALLVLIVVSSRASPEFAWKGALANAAILIALCLLVFVYGLGLQLPVWPALLN